MKTLLKLTLALLAAGLVRAEQMETEPNDVIAPIAGAMVFPEPGSAPVETFVLRGATTPAGDVDFIQLPGLAAGAMIHAHLDNGGAQSPESNTRALELALVDSLGIVIESDVSDGTGTGTGITGPALANVPIPFFAVPPYFLRVQSTEPGGVAGPWRLVVKWQFAPPFVAAELPGVAVPGAVDIMPGPGALAGAIAPFPPPPPALPVVDTDPVILPPVPPFTAVHLSLDGSPGPFPRGAASNLALTLPGALGGRVINAAGMGAFLDPPAEAVLYDHNSALPLPPAPVLIAAAPGAPPPVVTPYVISVSFHPHGMAAITTPAVTVAENAGTANVTVMREGGTFGPIAISYRTVMTGAAAEGADFTATTGTLNFAPGEMLHTISIPLVNDDTTEPEEKLEVELFSAVNSLPPAAARAVINILDDDDGDNSPATAPVLDATSGGALINGSIGTPGDQDWVRFTAPAGARVTAVLNTGATPALTEPILRLQLLEADGATVVESDRRDGWTGLMVVGGSLSRVPAIVSCPLAGGDYYLRLDAPEGILAGAWRLCLVLETQPAMPGGPDAEPLFSYAPWPVDSRTGLLTESGAHSYLLPASSGSVVLVAVDGDPERDGIGTEVLLGIGGGMPLGSSADLADPLPRSVGSFFDYPYGGGLSVEVSAGAPAGGSYRLVSAVLSPGVFRIQPTLGSTTPTLFATEGETKTITVERVMGNQGAATVDFTTENGTALAGSDYATVSGTLTFAPGEVEKTFTVQVFSDAMAEPSELLRLSFTGSTGAAIGVLPMDAGAIVSPGAQPHGRIVIRDPEVPNNTRAEAPLVTPTPPITRLSASLAAPAGDSVDMFAFTNAVPGARLWALSVPSGPPVVRDFTGDALLSAYAPGGGPALEEDGRDGFVATQPLPGWTGYAAAIAGRTLAAAGRHIIEVSVANHGLPYSVMVEPGANPWPLEAADPLDVFVTLTTGADLPETEPNGTAATAMPLLTLPRDVAVVAGEIAGADQDRYRLELGTGDFLFISLNEKPGTAAALDAAVELLAPDGSTRVLAGAVSSDTQPAESFVWPVTETGTWSVIVRPRSGAAAFSGSRPYQLMTARQSPPGPVISNIAMPAVAEAGVAVPLSVTVTSPGPAQGLVARIAWGDSPAVETLPLPPAATGAYTLSHIYQAAGLMPVHVALTDSVNGGTSSVPWLIEVCAARDATVTNWWPGDGHAQDIAGTAHGTLMNGATFATGQVAPAFALDGQDDFVRMGNVAALNPGTGSFTVEAWFQRTGVPASGAFRIASKGVSRASTPEWEGWALHGDSTNWIAFTVNDGTFLNYNNPNARGNAQTALPADGAWHHIAGVLDRARLEVRLYLDGQLARTSNLGGGFGGVSTGLSFAIGAQDTLGEGSTRETTHFFPGFIDEVRIRRRAVTAAEVMTTWQAGAAGHFKPAPALALMPPPELTLAAPPPAGGTSAGGTGPVLTWPSAIPGVRLEVADDLASWRWPAKLPVLSNGAWTFTDDGTARRRFFRLVTP